MSTLGNNIKEDIDGVYIFHDGDKIVIITYNGDLNDNRFSSHEIEEDIIKFLKGINEPKVNERISMLRNIVDAKDFYDKLNKNFRNFRLGSELFDNLDKLLIYLMIRHKEHCRKLFYRLDHTLRLIANP